MARTVANARSYGEGKVVVAPTGTTAPTDSTSSYSGTWVELGWITDAGITESHSVTTTVKYAWQGGTAIRTVKSQDTRTFKFQCYEENAAVLGLLRPGSTVSTTGAATTTIVTAFTGQDFRAFGLDFADTDVHLRKIIPQGEAEATADVVYVSNDVTIYEFTVTCYPDTDLTLYTEYTDNTADEVA